MRRINLTLTALIIFMVFPAVTSAGKMLSIQNRETVEADAERPQPRSFFSPRSRLNLLGLERETPYSLPKRAIAAGVTDTITILALRINFRYEDPDDALTTGRGIFDLRDTTTFLAEEGHALDPAPHNTNYFGAHLRAMARYYEIVSNGKLHLEYEVWPQGEDEAYQLDSSMAYYGSQPPNFGLGEYFHDALNKAYEVDGGEFEFRDASGKKKAVILFHAGADQQTNFSFSATDTPYDLYTGFAVFDSLNWVVFDTDTVSEGIIMPETMTQDNRVTVMNAVMAHEFGHQLGLIDLYNTGSNPFLTQMGDFALMDNNGMNTAVIFDAYGSGVFGTVPIFPSAWSRAFLGFDEVVEFRKGTSIELAAVKMETGFTKIAKIPISATEYYLLENRRSDVDGDVEGIQLDSSTNVILGPVKRSPLTQELVPLREYDLHLPEGSAGIAIWHVDEGVAAADYFPFDGIQNNFGANTLQWDRQRRFVRLVEADGNIDFGGNYHRGYGTPQDLFYAGNKTIFSTYTNPPTIGNDGGYTHIKIDNITSPAMLMFFDVEREMTPEMFPRRVSIPSNPRMSPIAADLDGDGNDEIITVSGKKILAMYTDGHDFLDSLGESDDFDTVFSPITATTDVNDGRPIDTNFVPMPIFAETQYEISFGPAVADFNDTTVVMVGTRLGEEYIYLTDTSTAGNPYRAELLWTSWWNLHKVTGILPDTAHNVVHFFHGDGEIQSFEWNNGTASTDNRLADSIVGACLTDEGMAVVCEGQGGSTLYKLHMIPFADLADRNLLVDDSVVIENEYGFYAPVATNFDRTGGIEVVLCSNTGHVLTYSFSADGIEKYEALDQYTGDTVAAGPAIGDVTGNGFPELIVPGRNTLYGYDRSGLTVVDFPLTVDKGHPGQLVITSPIISDISGDGRVDLAVAAIDSSIYAKTARVYYLDSLTSPGTIYLRTRDTTYYYYNYYSNVFVVSPGVFRVEGFPVPAGAIGVKSLNETIAGMGSPLHVKVGGNGYLVTTGGDGWLNAWQCAWTDGAAYWPMAGRSATGGGYLSVADLGEEQVLADFMPKDKFFSYPNPATGSSTTIHYYVNQPASVTVTIFDALGDRVTEMQREIIDGNREDEITWDLAGIASGVYHCRLEAIASGGGDQTVIFKSIAVVK